MYNCSQHDCSLMLIVQLFQGRILLRNRMQRDWYIWLVTFLNGRSHVTRYAGRTSSIAYINASVVQGSVIGPSSYDILASDLHPLSPQNIILKYADDTYLPVPFSNRHTVPSELNHISA